MLSQLGKLSTFLNDILLRNKKEKVEEKSKKMMNEAHHFALNEDRRLQ